MNIYRGLMRKVLVFSIIVLFISVGVQPVLADNPIITSKDINEDCIECKISDGYSHLKTRLLLVRLIAFVNFIFYRFGDIPEIEESCQNILDILNDNNPLDNPIICGVLLGMVNLLQTIGKVLYDIADVLLKIHIILYFMFVLIFGNLHSMMLYYVFVKGNMFDCPDWPWPYHYKSLRI